MYEVELLTPGLFLPIEMDFFFFNLFIFPGFISEPFASQHMGYSPDFVVS